MRRADRLFDIIQALRTAKGPVTAETLAKHHEVTVRTVYRDVATLQARRVPIEGAAGIGYMLRDDFRHFRADRILDWNILDESFPISGKTLFGRWQSRFGFEEASAKTRSPTAYKHPPGTLA
jgi:predicted DNA-binding transcriptional regulator YafY